MSKLSKTDLHNMDQTDPLSWTRAEFEFPYAPACGGELGKFGINLGCKSLMVVF